mgnify:FL=1
MLSGHFSNVIMKCDFNGSQFKNVIFDHVTFDILSDLYDPLTFSDCKFVNCHWLGNHVDNFGSLSTSKINFIDCDGY